jgi:hypothetical protein
MPRGGFDVETLVLWKSMSKRVLLGVSTRREGPGSDWHCQWDFASVIALPGGTWATMDLVPHCSPVYAEDEIDFMLYWLGDETFPHIAVTANHPACVPVDLYSFDPNQQRYKRVRHKCTD